MQDDGLMSLNSNESGTICEDNPEQQNEYLEYFVDDVSGAPLKTNLVREARDDEITGISKCNVWDKVPISECYNNTGKAPVGTRWIDINKGDEANPNYRSRFVGREFYNKREDGLFAATPPLEAIRALISLAASQCGRKGNIKKLSFIDISMTACTR